MVFYQKKKAAAEKELNNIKDYKFSLVFFIPAVKVNFYINLFQKIYEKKRYFYWKRID